MRSAPLPRPASAPAPALVCKGLVKRYGELVAVDGLDLEVAAGECFGLLGPNGAGKTTTVELFEGLLQPDGGSLEVLGKRWEGDGQALRARLGVQLQETRFPEKLRVIELAELFRSFYRDGLAPAAALVLVGLADKNRAFVRELSGGQKQRLSLACALVGDPEVLFLDEPTTGLDPASRRQIWEIVENLKARGRTVLLTTHYMEEAARLCDRVAIIDRGRILALGAPAALVASLGAEHVIELETEQEIPVEILDGLPGVEAIRHDGTTVRLTVRAVHRVVPPLLARLAESRIEARRLATHHTTLEDLFIALTGRTLEGGSLAASEGGRIA